MDTMLSSVPRQSKLVQPFQTMFVTSQETLQHVLKAPLRSAGNTWLFYF